MELTKALNRGARGLLGWSVPEQAKHSGVPVDTIRSFETGRTRRLSRDNEERAIAAFQAAGIGLLPSDETRGAGVHFLAPEGEA
jgi:hypothetical protein